MPSCLAVLPDCAPPAAASVPTQPSTPTPDAARPAWRRTVVRRATDPAHAWDALVVQSAHGDVAAFEALCREARPFVVRVARSAVGRLALAEEIAQDVLLKVWTHARTFDAAAGAATTWMATITRNRARDVARHLAPERAHDAPDAAVLLEALPDEADGPAELCERRQPLPALERAVGALPERDRELLRLAHAEGHSHAEIAAALDAPLGTIKTRLRRMHARLATTLAEFA